MNGEFVNKEVLAAIERAEAKLAKEHNEEERDLHMIGLNHFGGKSAYMDWVVTPHHMIGHRRPHDLLLSGHDEDVLQLLRHHTEK